MVWYVWVLRTLTSGENVHGEAWSYSRKNDMQPV